MLEQLATIPPGLITPDGERLNTRAYVFLILMCLAFFLPGFATIPPTDRDESLFAQASKQMIESGNYVDIHFQQEPRYKKPVGIYWLQAASVKFFSPHHLDQIWAYRIPSLIGATLAVVMTAALGALLFGPTTGFLAGIMMAGCLILNVEARIAKTDAALLGSILVMQYALARAYLNYGRRLDWRVGFAFWTALGLGILLKGPIILLVLFSTLLWLAFSERNLQWFKTLRPLWGLPYLLFLIAPWFVAIMMASHGQFLDQSAGHDMLEKFWKSQGRGFAPPGMYLVIFPLTFFPFALWPMLGIPDTWRQRREPSVRFCLGWIIPVWIVFELVLTKLPHYVMPTYPAIAMLGAKALLDGYPALREKRWRWLPPVAISLWLMAGVAIALFAAMLPHMLDRVWNPGQIAAGLLLLIAQGASLMLFFRRRESGVIAMTAGGLVFMMILFGSNLPYVRNLWVSSQILTMAETFSPCTGPVKIVSNYDEPSLVFMAGTDTHLKNDLNAIADDMRQDPCRVAVIEDNSGTIEDDQARDFARLFAGSARPAHSIGIIEGFVVPHFYRRAFTLFIMPPEKSGQ